MKRKTIILICVIQLLLLISCGDYNSTSNEDNTVIKKDSIKTRHIARIIDSLPKRDYADKLLLVKFIENASASDIQNLHDRIESTIVKEYTITRNLQLIRLNDAISLNDALNYYLSNSIIEYAEPDYLVKGTSIMP
ncbi:hypothetical protein MCHI_000800, partial [Candidatus Magnetoovum chiemensis]